MTWPFIGYSPVFVALVGCGASAVVAGAIAYLVRKRRNGRQAPVGVNFPGWALVTGSSCGLGQAV